MQCYLSNYLTETTETKRYYVQTAGETMAFWDKIGSMGNVEDRRGMPGGGLAVSGISGLVILLAFMFLSGGDQATLDQILNQVAGQNALTSEQQGGQFSGADEYEIFVGKVLGSNNEYWKTTFADQSKTYTEPKVVLFRSATQSGCGIASSQAGPHYCPVDQTIYLDETFFDILQQLGGSSGDVAQAYVLSHEVGHHVQNLQGTMESVLAAQQEGSEEAQKLAIGLELQADCYAGLWMNSIAEGGVFEPGEIEEALSAASAVGDDRVQQKMNGTVNPETWTHGSSAQRVTWFTNGFKSGDPSKCNPT